MTHSFRPRRLALLVASTAIAAGGVLVPTTAFATTTAAPQRGVADVADGVHVPDRGQQWQCIAAPCEPPGGSTPEEDHHDGGNHHDKWGHGKGNDHGKGGRHDKWGDHRPGRHDDGGQQWQCFAAPCEPPSGDRD
ncbi:hypothetical protein ACWGIU_34495 [Streptomyces sp. NPDC054840]